MIEIGVLTKAFGPIRALDELSFTAQPGKVTGLLGPNGSGKTTTLRILLGLVRADSGTALIEGQRYGQLARPMRTVGAVLEPDGFHPGRSAREHLRVYAAAGSVTDSKVEELLEMVGLNEAAGRKVGGYSLGMRQRLALATALLGDPGVIILDEPANGLDPQGVIWLRSFLQHLAHDQGRTVLVSSHVLGEVQSLIDDVVVIAAGRLVQQSTLVDLLATVAPKIKVAGPDRARLAAMLDAHRWPYQELEQDFIVTGCTAAELGKAAFEQHIELHQLLQIDADLEEAFIALVAGTAV